MSKLKIGGSTFSDTNLETDVCSHLRPILALLVSQGNSYDPSEPLQRDKSSASRRLVNGPLDFQLIEDSFEIPKFIVLAREHGTILCQTCWCAIVERKFEPIGD